MSHRGGLQPASDTSGSLNDSRAMHLEVLLPLSLHLTFILSKLHTSPADRNNVLINQQHLKMSESAHAYVRGNTVRFYEWLDSDAVKAALPVGPDVWICGDCHTGNLGPVSDLHGKIDIEVRDVDQTVIGNPAHDLIRLGLSLASAARGSDLPGVTTARMIEEMVDPRRSSPSVR